MYQGITKKSSKLQLNKLSLAISLISTSIFAIAPSVSFAAVTTDASVIRMIERSASSPATMCFVLDRNQSIINDLANLQQNVVVHEVNNNNKVLLDSNSTSIDNNTLCVSNLKNGQNYELTLRKGLKLTNGKTLNNDVAVPFSISDAYAQLRLPYNIILPKNGQNKSFNVQSINAPKFNIFIYKLNQRSVNDINFSDLFNNSINQYTLTQLLTNQAHKVYEKQVDLGVLEGSKEAAQNGDNSKIIARNQPQFIEVNLSDFNEDSNDGMYIVVAADSRIKEQDMFEYGFANSSSIPFIAKYMVITDLGLTTYKSDDSILVNVRSLTSAKTLENVKVDLIASNNEVLASAQTDKDGTVTFSKELISGKYAIRPTSIIASTDNDVYVLDLDSSPLYLEDNKGVSKLNNYETFAYTDRGIYREGEKVYYTALVRDANLQSVELPLTLQIRTPLNTELTKVLLDQSKAGGYSYDFDLPKGARHGKYTARLMLGDTILDESVFTVGSYVPVQINTSILNKDGIIPVDATWNMQSQANFNYGGAAANLKGDFDLLLSVDPNPIISNKGDIFKGFHFGPDSREFSQLARRENFSNLSTDVEGVMQHNVLLSAQPYPQLVTVTSTIYDTGNQAVRSNKSFKLAYNKPLIGIKNLSNESSDNRKVSFALCSYMQDGSTFPQDVEFLLYKEFVDYNFIYENGSWKYVRFTSRNLINQGKVKVDNQDLNKALIEANLDDGRYILEVKSDRSSSVLSFNKGYTNSDDANTPDRFKIFADKSIYQSGDMARLSFDSPFDGFANIAIGKRGVDSFKTIEVSQGHNEIEVPIKGEYSPECHALISLYSPINDSSAAITRAVGLIDLNIDISKIKLNVATNAAKDIKPNTDLNVEITATNIVHDEHAQKNNENELDISKATAKSHGYARVTLVDNGILSLTNYQSPNPIAAFTKDRAYNVSLYDAYGFLMKNPKQQGQGYGGLASEALNSGISSLDVLPTKTIALASKIVELKDGKANVTFKVPQFSGSLRLMTVAWDKDHVGSMNQDVLVRDNAVATIGLPRFLNMGDEAQGRLNLHNLTSNDSKFRVDISCTGAVSCSTQNMLKLKPGARNDSFFSITANETGIGHISLKVKNKEYNLNENYDIAVTSQQLPFLRTYLTFLQPNEKAKLVANGKYNDVDGITISRSKLPNVSVHGIMSQIDDFGLYSTVQIAASLNSKLLYGNELIVDKDDEINHSHVTFHDEAQLNNAIQEQVNRLLSAQYANGSFSDSDYDNCYIIDVLLRAFDKGFVVNQSAIDNSLNYLRNIANSLGNSTGGAYANEILSRYENINPAQLRYAIDEGRISAPVQLAHLANALLQTGDSSRAAMAIDKAINNLLAWQDLNDKLSKTKDRDEVNNLLNAIERYSPFGYSLRHDSFVLIGSCLRLNATDKVIAIINKIRALQETPDYLSSTTMDLMLRANSLIATSETDDLGAANLKEDELKKFIKSKLTSSKKAGLFNVASKGQEKGNKSDKDKQAKDSQNIPDYKQLKDGSILITNRGQSPVFINASVIGQYQHDNNVNNKGIKVAVNYFNRSQRLDLSNYQFNLNEEVLMEVNFTRDVASRSPAVIKIKLPAGFEFVRLAQNEDPSFNSLLSNIYLGQPDNLQVGDDMIVATTSNYYKDTDSVFIVLRAAYPGVYKQGEALVQLQQATQIYGSSLDSNNNIVINGLK